MTRNNQDRLNSQVQSADPPQEVKKELQFVVPTEFVELPSKGLLYPEGHPLKGKEEIEIRLMTAKEEDILTDKTLLKKGVAIDRMMANIILDKTVKPHTLLSGDRTAIMIAARKSAYGAEYDTKIACPVCFSQGRHVFDLENVENVFSSGKNTHPFNERMNLVVTTPKTKAELELRMLTGADEKRMLDVQNNNKKLKLPENALINQLRILIVSVNGNEDRQYINSFIDIIPAYDSKFIREVVKHNTPTTELKEEYVCGECGASTEIDVPFTTDFFWPK